MNMTDAEIVKNIIKNRQRIEITLLERYNITDIELADFFEVPLSCIKKDMLEITVRYTGKTLSNPRHLRFNTKEAKRIRGGEISRRLKESTEMEEKTTAEEEVYWEFGLWRKPVDINKTSSHLVFPDGLAPNRIGVMRKAFALASRGISTSDLIRYLKLSKTETEILRSQGIMELTFRGTDVEDKAIQLVLNGANPEEVSQLIGYPKSDLKRIISEKSKKRLHQYYIKLKAIYKEKSAEKERIKEDVYKRWMSGKNTQEELANEYGVTRVTIINWVREIRMKIQGQAAQSAHNK